ncbi:sulfite exporter TauE/SafE family protein [Wenzhouxiangella sp. XN79A]|uniref:sulfite exporter TauE/SafE family protein n=1 Tax=Wenzhouxiangella sp. XN79A TaxID=2724193 RepID=UPI00144A799E|nr:sulfite exporter TauE/SafE family protein [Wenzhouxiangella sp. XN79A]NKI35285.1 sulfite exporter TauE/SafE family protein [Wenzhouxiangella sp. XN79A]
MIDLLALIATGAVAGVLAGLLGIGGGLVIVPALSALWIGQGVDPALAVPGAVATSLASMLLTSASSALAHARSGGMDWAAAGRLGPALALGGLVGGSLAPMLGGDGLALAFALLAGIIGLKMLLNLDPPPSDRRPAPRGWWLAGPLIGAASALIGIGGGSFNVPYLVRNGYPTLRAVAIAAACGWPIAAAGVAGFALQDPSPGPGWGQFGFLDLHAALVIGVAGLASAPLGVRLAGRLGSDRLRRVFGLALLLVAARMAF